MSLTVYIPPYKEDFFQRIVNMKWGPGVIVVFVDWSVVFYGDGPPASTYLPYKNAKALTTWKSVPYGWNLDDSMKPFGYPSVAYAVPATGGEFMHIVAPTLPAGEVNGIWNGVYVFAVVGDTAAALSRAIEGTKLIVAAMAATYGPSDLPKDYTPPGLLWAVDTGEMTSGQEMTWKIRYGLHRGDNKTAPPNAMVQCYPLGPSFEGTVGGEPATFDGYFMDAYRLDSTGTGRAYGVTTVDPAWFQPIGSYSSGTFRGIPFQDPPPLISTDV